ncbi:HYR-like domain-containing protein, partial [Psychroserpens sp. BH13MA-6]
MKQTLLLMTFLFFGTSLSYGQCPDHTSSVCDGQRVSVDVDTLPFCDVGSTSIEGDINQNLDCEDITGLNCFEFMFFRAENSTTESFTFDVGQGQGCTGELDASYFVYDGSSCQPLSDGGSQTNITFDFPLGVNEIYIYLCINSNAQVTMCNVCRERPPCTVDVACQQLEDITGNYCSGDPCNIPAPTTVVSEVFAQNELCDFEVIMESSDAGETDCVDSNGNNQIEVTRTYTLKYFDLGINDFITIQTCQQNIILTQENCCVAPSITCPSDVTIQCDESSDPVFTGEATSIEGCGDVIISYVDVETPQDCINETIITRTWTATDENQDSQQCVQIITVVDTEAPELSGVPSDIVVACDAIPAVPTVTATDNCTAEIVVEFEEQFPNASCLDDAQIIQTWTATDECGNTVSQSRTITLIDDTPPVITCPEDLELQCFSQDPEWDISPEALNSFASAIEACSGEAEIDFSDTTTGNECGFTVERTWSATDACGNQSTCVQTITIIDEIPPVLFNVPVDVTVECDDIPSVPDNIFATDECDELVTVNFSETTVAGDCANAYTIIRTWTAIDACDNQTSASQNISVDDNSAPVAPTAPGDLNLECASDMPPPFDLTAVDNCDGDITVSPSAVVTPGDCANQFTMIRTWTFTDLCGNTSSVSQTINVNDNTAPVAPTAPADLNLQCASDVPPPVELTAVDNCDGDITVSPTTVTIFGECNNQFSQVRTWTFVDGCGNVSSVSQTINVNDDTAPVAPTAPVDLNLQCASDVPDLVELTAVDNCDGDITVSPTTVTIFGECNN